MIISLLNGIEIQNPGIFNVEGAAAIIFYFTLYSFIGWLLENSYSFFTSRVFFKPNFLWGPFKPMYGFAPILLVYFIPSNTHWAVIVLLCFFIPTIVEYVSGALLQKLFNRKWWDYSDTPMQLHGHICLPFSLCWVVLAIICLQWIHPALTAFYGAIAPFWAWIWAVAGLYFLADLALATRRHSLKDLVTDESSNPIQ
ncbi:putative ABC transporter permease [Neobacillus sp. NPDC058068]|uniref:putative ABC transporter permease n=1 Tax=Neobacillus sp. NPDC058068 TaxID=3346325 RepID=UPI0036DF8C5A